MSAKRIAMRKIREILRLRLEAGLSVRQIHASAKVSVGAIQKLLKLDATATHQTVDGEGLYNELRTLSGRYDQAARAASTSSL